MIKSKYISDIIDLLLDGDSEGISARQQIQFLSDDKYDYTGGGLFVTFSHADEVVKYKCDKENLILDGVKISSKDFHIEADATLFFKNGLVDYLEIWCYAGDYPIKELTKYTLTQVWKDSADGHLTIETNN